MGLSSYSQAPIGVGTSAAHAAASSPLRILACWGSAQYGWLLHVDGLLVGQTIHVIPAVFRFSSGVCEGVGSGGGRQGTESTIATGCGDRVPVKYQGAPCSYPSSPFGLSMLLSCSFAQPAPRFACSLRDSTSCTLQRDPKEWLSEQSALANFALQALHAGVCSVYLLYPTDRYIT